MSLPPSLAALAAVPGPPGPAQRLMAQLADLLFPPRCAGCDQGGSLFCAACLSRVQPVPAPLCRRCGAPLRDAAGDGDGYCVECHHAPHYVSAIRGAALYAHPLSTAIHRFKYNGRRALGEPLGRLMADYWQGRAVTADLVVAVPLHPNRRRERGFNQAQVLAAVFCRHTELPLLREGVLRRERETHQQMALGMAERRQNVAGAFGWHGPPLEGLKVLLIDDVATTGSTLEACGEALVAAGAGKVWALTVARAAH